MHIMTKDGWKQLSPVCQNHVWEKVSFNYLTGEWERNEMSGTLRHVSTTDRAEPGMRPFDEKRYWESVNRFCSDIRKAVKESQDRRAGY